MLCTKSFISSIIFPMKSFSPYKVYLSTRFFQSLFFVTMTTVNLVYQATVVGLNPLQLVLVGTVLETFTFLFEIPTGIMADTYSRKLSVVIGVFLVGLGFMVEASVPIFLFVLLSQIIWGIGFTFISGAREAWITDEIGREEAGKAFLKGEQISQLGSIVGIVAAVALASINIRLPIFLGGMFHSLWGIALFFLMTERHFTPTPRTEQETWKHFFATFRKGMQLIRAHQLLLTIILIGGVFGMFSEGFDRMWQTHLIHNFVFPSLGGLKPIVWFGIISMVAMLLTAIATKISRRQLDTNNNYYVTRTLFSINTLLMVSVIGFGIAGNFPIALAFYWLTYLFRQTSEPIYLSWLNNTISSDVRATILSISSQANAVGQIIGGPILGLIATVFSLRTGMVWAGFSLIPVLLLYVYLMIRHPKKLV